MDKRSASQQRRTNQNRAARQSLASRRAAAAAGEHDSLTGPDPDVVVPDDVVAPEGGVAPDEVTSAAKGGWRNRLAGAAGPPAAPRPTRSGRPARAPSPVPDTGPGLRGWWQAVRLTPGGRWVLASFLLSLVVAVGFGAFARFPVNDHLTAYLGATASGQKPAATESSRTLIDLLGPSSGLILGSPLLIVGAALAALRRPQRRRAWYYCALALGLWLLLLGGLLLFPASLILCAAFWFGVFQSSRAERTSAPARGAMDAPSTGIIASG